MKIYKLVNKIDDKLVSIRAGGLSMVEYRIGEWSKSPNWLSEKGYDLCVFEEKRTARIIHDLLEKQSIIIECEAEGIHSVERPYLCLKNLAKGIIKSWENGAWPKLATTMAVMVKPIKIIS